MQTTTNGSGRAAVKVIGAAIRHLREQRGLTLEGLATAADISYQYLSGIETGKENFSIRILEKISGALELPLLTVISLAYQGHGGRALNGHTASSMAESA